MTDIHHEMFFVGFLTLRRLVSLFFGIGSAIVGLSILISYVRTRSKPRRDQVLDVASRPAVETPVKSSTAESTSGGSKVVSLPLPSISLLSWFDGARLGDLQIIQSGISAGLDVNECRDEDGLSILHQACRSGSVECVRHLINAGADCHVESHSGHTCIHMASIKGHAEIIRLLLRYQCTPHHKSDWDSTPLQLAACQGHKEAAMVLLLAGADPNSHTKTRSTPLIAACFNGHHQIVEVLLQHGANPNFANANRMTAMHAAAVNGHVSILKQLNDSGRADWRMKNSQGQTALDIAASKNLQLPFTPVLPSDTTPEDTSHQPSISQSSRTPDDSPSDSTASEALSAGKTSRIRGYRKPLQDDIDPHISLEVCNS